LASVDINKFDKSHTIINCIIYTNKTVHFLNTLRATAAAGSETYILKDDLLFYRNTFIVFNTNYLYTNLIREAYNQISTVYPGRDKTYQFLRFCYYWSKIYNDIIHFIYNCHICKHTDFFRDKIPGFLYSLLISDKLWQYIIINFKSFFINKNRFDNVYIIIDHLFK